MKKSKFTRITSITMVALIIFLITYIIVLGGNNMNNLQIAIGLSLASFGIGVSLISAILDNIKIEE